MKRLIESHVRMMEHDAFREGENREEVEQ